MNSCYNTVEERSEKLSKDLKLLLGNKEKFNLVSFSVSGVDTRVVLNEHKEIKEKVNKFLMIGTPN